MVDPLVKSQGTLLQILGVGIVPYSTRDATQTLEPIAASRVQKRSVNGQLHDVSYAQFWKYQSEITCRDFMAPVLNNIRPGSLLTIYCVSEIIAPPGQSPWRPVVPHSNYLDAEGFVHFRPILQMMVTGFSSGQEEWKANVSWKMNLEEV
jgi:hypothetical protein